MELARLPLAGEGGLIDVLRTVRDPRRRNGMRHPGRALLAAAICAVLSGCRSVQAIAEWAAGQPESVRRTLGFNRKTSPSEKTFRTYLQRIDSERLAVVFGDWFAKEVEKERASALAVDGKTVRGSKQGGQPAVQLISAVTHQDGVTFGQMVIEGGNEIGAANRLLAALNIRGMTITFDALHTQRETAFLVVHVKEANYVMTVKGNQPSLLMELENAPTALFSPDT